MTTLNNIEDLTQEYAARRDSLDQAVKAMEARVQAIKEECLPEIKRRALSVAAARDRLADTIDQAPTLFNRPRTRLFAGIRVGLRKLKGKVEIDDEPAVIRRIRKFLPEDQQELLIRVRESVDKNMASQLTASDCKRLGISITEDEDVAYIKPADSEIDKLVDALLADDKEGAAA